MNDLESQWLGQRLASIPDDQLFPLLNVGSSTLEFRTKTQPYIDNNIFAPLRARGGKVWASRIARTRSQEEITWYDRAR